VPKTVVLHEREHLYAAEPKTDEGRRLSHALLALRRAENAQADRALHSTRLGTLDFTALRYLVQAKRDDRLMSPKDVIVMLNTSSATECEQRVAQPPAFIGLRLGRVEVFAFV
jgi:hypothetical protein